ncbi:hypothetical protein [Paractinoplanes deccanensis]|uniref:hypothetical protein n=1 Tax=Paractinoplanes deccanensis TaxID=113561 RepID=UPI0019458C3A|nr:hypothetical protein [Actinoplanes deccanensis]
MVAVRALDTGTKARFVVSVALGAAAFLSDFVPGTLGAVLLTLTSSGLAWGITALLVGFRQSTWRTAVVESTAALLVATVVYYAMILGISRRWRGGTLQDGSSADLSSLLSVGRAVAFWAVASVCAGLLLGAIGWRVSVGSDRQAALLTLRYRSRIDAFGKPDNRHLGDRGVLFVMAAAKQVRHSALRHVCGSQRHAGHRAVEACGACARAGLGLMARASRLRPS